MSSVQHSRKYSCKFIHGKPSRRVCPSMIGAVFPSLWPAFLLPGAVFCENALPLFFAVRLKSLTAIVHSPTADSFSIFARFMSIEECAYRSRVMVVLAWPRILLRLLISTPASTRRVAKVWRNVFAFSRHGRVPPSLFSIDSSLRCRESPSTALLTANCFHSCRPERQKTYLLSAYHGIMGRTGREAFQKFFAQLLKLTN